MAEAPICRACGREIADKASFCMYCGASLAQGEPNRSPRKLTNWQQTAVLLVLVLAAVAIISVVKSGGPSSTDSVDKSNSAKATQLGATPANLNDADYLSNHYQSLADSGCAHDADGYLRSIAKYDFSWDHTGMLEDKFDKYLPTVKRPGMLTVASQKAKLQNGFGAFQHIELFCDYDTQTLKVVDFWINAPDAKN